MNLHTRTLSLLFGMNHWQQGWLEIPKRKVNVIYWFSVCFKLINIITLMWMLPKMYMLLVCVISLFKQIGVPLKNPTKWRKFRRSWLTRWKISWRKPTDKLAEDDWPKLWIYLSVWGRWERNITNFTKPCAKTNC